MINNAEFFGGIEPCDLDGNCASSGTAYGWAYNFDAGGSGDGNGYADGHTEIENPF